MNLALPGPPRWGAEGIGPSEEVDELGPTGSGPDGDEGKDPSAEVDELVPVEPWPDVDEGIDTTETDELGPVE